MYLFLGCDKEYLQSAFLIKHKEFLNFLHNKDKEEIFKRFADEYLEKIIQIPFSIPALNEEAIENYINELLTPIDPVKESNIKSKDLYENFKKSLNVKLFTKMLIEKNLNPRRIKRILNIVFLNYLFIIFKSDKEDIQKQDLDLLMLLGIIRDQYSVYYRKNLLSEILCKRTFKIMLDFIKNEENKTELEDTNIESITENEEINDLFNIFFKELKIKSYSKLDEVLNNIGNILTISHTTTSENYEELYWGEIGEIKSTTGTNKTLKVFLNRIKSKSKTNRFFVMVF